MYLSGIQIDTKKPEARVALSTINPIHGAVERCFQGKKKRILWRLDELHGATYLLITSEDKPNFTNLTTQFGVPGTEIIKDYENLFTKCVPGTTWHFRLVANPTYTVKEPGSKERGRVKAHVSINHQKQWLLQRAETKGFSIQENTLHVTNSQWINIKRYQVNGKNISLKSVTFEGILTVTDQEKFIDTLTHGIGREKAFGMGMLTIMSTVK